MQYFQHWDLDRILNIETLTAFEILGPWQHLKYQDIDSISNIETLATFQILGPWRHLKYCDLGDIFKYWDLGSISNMATFEILWPWRHCGLQSSPPQSQPKQAAQRGPPLVWYWNIIIAIVIIIILRFRYHVDELSNDAKAASSSSQCKEQVVLLYLGHSAHKWS